jgi:hypothetical protein
MTTLTDSVCALTRPIGQLGGMWMLDRAVLDAGRAAGYPNGYAYYITGRGGVLGDVDADVVTAAFAFFDPGLVRLMWEKGVPVEGALAAAHRYGAACAEMGRTLVAGFDGAQRLAELAGRVADGVDVAGLALFAGWRAEPRPQDAAARAFFLLHVLRELRGSVHIVAIVACGVSPLAAVVAHGGAAQARLFGWPEPHGEVPADLLAEAEALTDTILAARYASVLSEGEVAELATLVRALSTHVSVRTGGPRSE